MTDVAIPREPLPQFVTDYAARVEEAGKKFREMMAVRAEAIKIERARCAALARKAAGEPRGVSWREGCLAVAKEIERDT